MPHVNIKYIKNVSYLKLSYNMPTTYRFEQRKKQLERFFSKNTLKSLWKNKVKSQVRSMSVQDLHDFYDFHRRLDENVSKIVDAILSCQYKVQTPLIFTLEKKLGICRHINILSPSDTLVLQTLIESFGKNLLQSAPSQQAYYSRDKNPAIKLPHETSSLYDNWFFQWKLYQKQVLHFTATKKYIIVTDLSNYYDSIRLRELRRVISGYVKCDEVFLDLIFDMIENLSWKPDYLPGQSIGIPVINLEAIRLLAHTFLFEIDTILKNRVKDNFVRWMDDIIIGVDDIDDAKYTLQCMSDVLKSRGLSLNMAKTRIFTSEEARRHFLFDENIKLNVFERSMPTENEFLKFFRYHWKNNKSYRYFDKVLKRFLTIAGKYKFTGLLRYLPEIFENYADVRSNIRSYLYKLGYNKKTANALRLLLKIKRYDDITLFLLVALITDWNIGFSKFDKKFIYEISTYLKSLMLKNKEFNFYSYLWFAAKYEMPNQLYDYLNKYQNFWIKNPFLTRQVAAIIPRLLPTLKEKHDNLSNLIIQRDYNDSSSVIYNMDEIKKTANISHLHEYLFPTSKHKKGYPLQKFLILYNFCLEHQIDLNIKNKISMHIQDNWMLFWLQNIKK